MAINRKAMQRIDKTDHRTAGCCLAAWTPESGICVLRIGTATSNTYRQFVLQPLPITMGESITRVSKRSRQNPGRFFPRLVFTTTPANVTIDDLHERKVELPADHYGRSFPKPNRKADMFNRFYPHMSNTDALYDRTLSKHQARLIQHAQKRARQWLQVVFYGRTSKRTFKDDFELQQWQQLRDTVRVDRAYRQHIADVVLDADNRERYTQELDRPDRQVKRGYAFGVQKRAEQSLIKRIERIPGRNEKRTKPGTEKQKGKKRDKAKQVFRYTNQPPVMFSELMQLYDIQPHLPLDRIPLVADFRRSIVPNWKINDGTFPMLDTMQPTGHDIVPSILNHYGIWVRACLTVLNDYAPMLWEEANQHQETFNTKLHSAGGRVIGGLVAAEYRTNLKKSKLRKRLVSLHNRFRDPSNPVTHNYLPIGAEGLARALMTLMTIYHPIMCAHVPDKRVDARDYAMGSYRNWKTRKGIEYEFINKHQYRIADPLYQFFESVAMHRYVTLCLRYGIAPPAYDIATVLPLSNRYRKLMTEYRDEHARRHK